MTHIDLSTPLPQRPAAVSTGAPARETERVEGVRSASAPRAGPEPAAREAPAPERETPAPKRDLEDAVTHLNDLIQDIRRELRFTVDETSGHTVITVIDVQTQRVVRQIPPQEVVDIIHSLEARGASLTGGVKV